MRYLLLLGLIALTSAAWGQTSYPMLTQTYPTGLQRGTTAEVTVQGTGNFAGAYRVVFEGEGLKAEILPQQIPPPEPRNPNSKPVVNTVTLKVTAAPEATPGVREFRVATPRGVSTIGQIVVGDDPEVMEAEPNDGLQQAQAIAVPVTVNGKVQQNEDVDVYKVTARAGDQMVFSVLAARLQDKIHDLQPGGGGTHIDPMLVLLDSSGRELASNDDFHFADPLLVYTFAKAGEYYLQVRDVRYMGNATWVYRLTATRRPYLTGIFPFAGPPGAPMEVTPVGFNLGDMKSAKVELPRAGPGPQTLQIKAGDGLTNPVSVIVSDLSEGVEREPNDGPKDASEIAIPAGVNGRIGQPGDRDSYRFHATKGQAFTFEIEARRFGSALDSFLSVLDGADKELASNDDAPRTKDSRLEWTASSDGDFVLQVRDLHDRGGEGFFYHLTARRALPDFTVECDGDKAQICPGGGTAWYVKVTRTGGFTGPVKLAVKGLPAGVSATCATIPPSMTQGCIILSAAADTKTDVTNVEVVGSAERALADGKTESIEHKATILEEIYTPGGGRALYPVTLQTISVTPPADILVEASPSQITLKPGQSAKIDVKIKRRADYTKPVTLDVILQHLGQQFGNPLPPGMTIDEGKSKTALGDNENEGWITLKAADNAGQVENIPIAILGQVSINFVVKVSYAAPPVMLTVASK